MSKHTPGPWGNHKWNSEEHQISALGGTVALINHDHSHISDEAADANARLIAAAPDLLAALHRAVNHLIMDGVSCDDAPQALRQARAAIAKAEGGAT